MIRSLIIIIQIAALVMLLRTEFVQYLLSDIQGDLSDWMTEYSQIAEKRELQELRDIIQPFTAQMKDYQREYVQEITSNKYKLQEFNRRYCEGDDKNPFVYGASLRQICAVIDGNDVLKS